MKSFIPLLLLLAVGCTVSVKTAQKPNQSFEDYETWCWLKGCELVYQGPNYYYDSAVVEEFANAIAYNMHEKGYVQQDQESDLLVNYFIVLKEDSASVQREYEGMLKVYDFPQYQRFLKGSLVIDVIDRENSEVVWRSSAVRYMEMNPTYDRDLIWKAVAKAMKKFPGKK